jgi:tetratricopeptide (TPR) repeat protein
MSGGIGEHRLLVDGKMKNLLFSITVLCLATIPVLSSAQSGETLPKSEVNGTGDVLALALHAAQAIPYDGSKANKLAEVAKRYAEAGQCERALEIVGTIEPAGRRARALADIASTYAEAGQEEKASEILSQAAEAANRMRDCYSNRWVRMIRAVDDRLFNVLDELEQKMSENPDEVRGQQELADWANQMHEYYNSKAFALANVASEYAKLGNNGKASGLLSQASEIARRTRDAAYKEWMLATVACGYIHVGHYEEASQMAQSVQEVSYRKAIARSYADAGQYETAMEIANLMDEAGDRTDVLICIATACEGSGQGDKAAEVLLQALAGAQTIDDPYLKASNLLEVARQYARTGEEDKALGVLSQALDSARAAEDDFLLFGIAVRYSIAGRYEQAEQIAEAIVDASFKAGALAEVASGHSQAGREQEAAQMFSKALQAANRGASDKDRALFSVARACARSGRLDQAHEVAEKVSDPEWKASALVEVAGKCGEEEAKDRAQRILSRCIAVAETIESPLQRVNALLKVDKCFRDLEVVEVAY